jgi:hypothetical protein
VVSREPLLLNPLAVLLDYFQMENADPLARIGAGCVQGLLQIIGSLGSPISEGICGR